MSDRPHYGYQPTCADGPQGPPPNMGSGGRRPRTSDDLRDFYAWKFIEAQMNSLLLAANFTAACGSTAQRAYTFADAVMAARKKVQP